MAQKEVNPETMQRIMKLVIAIATAIAGFFSGMGAHAATVMLGWM